MDEILRYLNKYGQCMDADIAAATGVPVLKVRQHISELSSQGQVMSCKVIRFNNGKPIEGIQCRAAGTPPVSSPGRKPGAQAAAL